MIPQYMEANTATSDYWTPVRYVSSIANEEIGVFNRIEGDICDSGMWRKILAPDIPGIFVPNVLSDLIKRIKEIRSLPDNWDAQGTAAPNYKAYYNARKVVEVLSEMDFIPSKIVPSAEEGIGIFFAKGNRYGFVECFNEGEVVVAMSDRQGHRRVWQIGDIEDDIKEALETLKGFIDAA